MRLKYKRKGHHQGCCFPLGSLQTNVSQTNLSGKAREDFQEFDKLKKALGRLHGLERRAMFLRSE
jgi:hypothetical protein